MSINDRLKNIEAALANRAPHAVAELDWALLIPRHQRRLRELMDKDSARQDLVTDDWSTLIVLKAIALGIAPSPGEFYLLHEVCPMLNASRRDVEYTKYPVVTSAAGEIEPAIRPLQIMMTDVYTPEIIELIRVRLAKQPARAVTPNNLEHQMTERSNPCPMEI